MKKIDDLVTRLRNFEKMQPKIVREVVERNQQLFIGLITSDQLYGRGVDALGNPLREYTNRTIAIKRAKGQPTGRVTLKDTGAFHESMYIKFNGDSSFQVVSGDSKADEIADKYGNVLGWTDANMTFINQQFIKPALLKYLKG